MSSEGQRWHGDAHRQAGKLSSILADQGGRPMSGHWAGPRAQAPRTLSLISNAAAMAMTALPHSQRPALPPTPAAHHVGL